MKRRMGWLGRLLGRDAAPASIIPTDDEDEEAAWLSRPAAEEDYSAPLATRLDAISRQRPVASASASKPSTRLQIVPQEAPREIFVPAARALEDERVRELGAPEFPSVATLGAASLAEVEAPSATEGDVALSGSEHEDRA
jgi:hypothetical protein